MSNGNTSAVSMKDDKFLLTMEGMRIFVVFLQFSSPAHYYTDFRFLADSFP